MSKRALLILGLLLTPALAGAQTSTTSTLTTPYEQRGFVQVGGGAQSGSHTLNSTSTFTIYDEQGTVAGAQEYSGGAIWNIGGGARVWKNLVASLNYTRKSDSMDSAVVARVPHPLFANRPRETSLQVDELKHSENAYHLSAMWMVPLNEDLTLGFGGGPSFVNVSHEFATFGTGAGNRRPARVRHRGDSGRHLRLAAGRRARPPTSPPTSLQAARSTSVRWVALARRSGSATPAARSPFRAAPAMST